MHEQGWIHRDIKPGNISSSRTKLSDFSLNLAISASRWRRRLFKAMVLKVKKILINFLKT